MSQSSRLHPASQAGLPLLIAVTLLAGFISMNVDSPDHAIWGLVFFGWSLAAFVLHVVAWLLREHELWRRELIERPDKIES